MRHILLFFHHYRTPQDVGGLRSWHIGNHFARMGLRVTVVIPGVDPLTGSKYEGLGHKFLVREYQDGVEIIRTNSTANERDSKIKRSIYYLTASLTQFLSTFSIENVDMLISTSIPLSSLILSHMISRIRKIPHIIDVRDLSIDTALELGYFPNNILTKYLLRIENWLYKQADSLICVSSGFAEVLKSKGIRNDKIHVIPIGYDKDTYERKANWNRDIKSELDLFQKFVVLYAGSMGYVVDILTLLDAAKRTLHNKDIVYLFIGHGQNFSKYRGIARDLKLNCFFKGPIPKLDIPVFCAQSDLCVYPLKGGKLIGSLFGNKVFDYMGSGTPIIYSGPEGDIQQLIKRSGGGIYIPAGDSKSLADTIMELHANPDRVRLLGKNAKRYIEDKYTVTKMMTRFQSVVSAFLK